MLASVLAADSWLNAADFSECPDLRGVPGAGVPLGPCLASLQPSQGLRCLWVLPHRLLPFFPVTGGGIGSPGALVVSGPPGGPPLRSASAGEATVAQAEPLLPRRCVANPPVLLLTPWVIAAQTVQKMAVECCSHTDRMALLERIVALEPGCGNPATEGCASWTDDTVPVIQSLAFPKAPFVMPPVCASVCVSVP